MTKIEYREIDVETAPEEDLHLLLDFGDKIFREFEHDDPLVPHPIRIRASRQPDKESKVYRTLAISDGLVIGSASIAFSKKEDPGWEKNRESCFLNVSVLSEFRKQGIARELIKKSLVKVANYPDVKNLYSGTDNELGRAVLEHYGGKVALSGAENRLRWDDIDWDLMQQWVDEGRKRGIDEGISTEEFEDCPEECIEEYTALYTETMNQQPLGDIDVDIAITPKTRRETEERFKTIGLEWHTRITRERDGTISGLTEYMFIPDIPHRIMQNLTGVKEEYRGRGLGKWLKAEMLFQMREKYEGIKYIGTGNATSNAPMLSINERMGFKKHKEEANYKFELEAFKEKFNQ